VCGGRIVTPGRGLGPRTSRVTSLSWMSDNPRESPANAEGELPEAAEREPRAAATHTGAPSSAAAAPMSANPATAPEEEGGSAPTEGAAAPEEGPASGPSED
jgi:hypothetical protein